ncbi:MAG: hypothetical protein V4858_25270 [Pseudomonadota bacterium]
MSVAKLTLSRLENLLMTACDAVMLAIKKQSAHVSTLRRQKLGLMQDLLTGKVPVTVDAPPSEAIA